MVVRIGCDHCGLARLAQRFGAKATLDEVLREIAADRPFLDRRGNQDVPKCHAGFVDLDPSRGRRIFRRRCGGWG